MISARAFDLSARIWNLRAKEDRGEDVAVQLAAALLERTKFQDELRRHQVSALPQDEILMYRLVNIPHINSNVQIRCLVEGETIRIIACPIGSVFRDGLSVEVTNVYISNRMMNKPEALRGMIGNMIVFSIEAAREAGYAMAMADIRKLIGVKQD